MVNSGQKLLLRSEMTIIDQKWSKQKKRCFGHFDQNDQIKDRCVLKKMTSFDQKLSFFL